MAAQDQNRAIDLIELDRISLHERVSTILVEWKTLEEILLMRVEKKMKGTHGQAVTQSNLRPSERRPRTASESRDVRSWLRSHGYEDVAAMIDRSLQSWAESGRLTRRNWWDILAGTRSGRPRKVNGIIFPVLAAAQTRQGLKLTSNALARERTAPRKDAAENSRRARRPDPSKIAVSNAKPFIKWAGGKRQILAHILAALPKKYGMFHEPFVGGGAVFFGLRPSAAILYDRNERLIRAYNGVKNSVELVIDILKTYRNAKSVFLEARKKAIDNESDADVAAWLIFLNKTGFNGIYRVNSQNQFNVPYADNQNARICDEDNLRACAAALASAELKCADFQAVFEYARPGDAVYFDPPYIPVSGTSYFTSYTSQGFGVGDQTRLRDVAFELRERGVSVLLSNSSAPAVKELYGEHFECVPVSAFRLVNSNPRGRGRITELLIK